MSWWGAILFPQHSEALAAENVTLRRQLQLLQGSSVAMTGNSPRANGAPLQQPPTDPSNVESVEQESKVQLNDVLELTRVKNQVIELEAELEAERNLAQTAQADLAAAEAETSRLAEAARKEIASQVEQVRFWKAKAAQLGDELSNSTGAPLVGKSDASLTRPAVSSIVSLDGSVPDSGHESSRLQRVSPATLIPVSPQSRQQHSVGAVRHRSAPASRVTTNGEQKLSPSLPRVNTLKQLSAAIRQRRLQLEEGVDEAPSAVGSTKLPPLSAWLAVNDPAQTSDSGQPSRRQSASNQQPHANLVGISPVASSPRYRARSPIRTGANRAEAFVDSVPVAHDSATESAALGILASLQSSLLRSPAAQPAMTAAASPEGFSARHGQRIVRPVRRMAPVKLSSAEAAEASAQADSILSQMVGGR